MDLGPLSKNIEAYLMPTWAQSILLPWKRDISPLLWKRDIPPRMSNFCCRSSVASSFCPAVVAWKWTRIQRDMPHVNTEPRADRTLERQHVFRSQHSLDLDKRLPLAIRHVKVRGFLQQVLHWKKLLRKWLVVCSNLVCGVKDWPHVIFCMLMFGLYSQIYKSKGNVFLHCPEISLRESKNVKALFYIIAVGGILNFCSVDGWYFN